MAHSTEINVGEPEHGGTELTKVLRLPRLLRTLGAIVLLAASAAFIAQSWAGWDSLLRYYSFLGFTACISLAGVFCAARLREAKGARTFFGIAAAFLPAHFVQLGALLYSVVIGVPAIHHLFVLCAPSLGAALLALGVALPLLGGITFAGFSAMVRPHAKLLTIFFLFANAVLLLPTREPLAVATVALVLTVCHFLFEYLYVAQSPLLRSLEGRLVRMMLTVPAVLLVGRNLALYPTEGMIVGAGFTLLTVFLLAVAAEEPAATGDRSKRVQPIQELAEILAFGSIGLSWWCMANGLFFGHLAPFEALIRPYREEMFLPLLILPMALLLTAASAVVPRLGSVYRRGAGWIAVATMLFQLCTVPGILSSFLCIVTAIIVTLGAFAIEDRGLLRAGFTGLALGLLYHLRYALDLYSLSPWLTLALTGATLVLLGSYVEKNYAAIVEWIARFRGKVATWR